MIKNFTAYCKDLFKSGLVEYEGEKIRPYDIAYKIHRFHRVEAAGTDYIEYIQSWFKDCMACYDYEMLKFGKSSINVLENPMSYFYRMVMVALMQIEDLMYKKGVGNPHKMTIKISEDFIYAAGKFVDEIPDSYNLFK